ncbi:Membrane protein [Citrus sinensis]|uniref:Membrane protein n=1 Tax=Citrus sinensis TaxID=2711 RepID=A0ACB8LF88_CITSI|nr:Membrane protein [Citrus sinensis]
MYLPKIHRQPVFFQIPQTTLPRRPEFPLKFNPSSSSRLLSSSLSKPSFKLSSIPNAEASIVNNKKEKAAIDVCNSLSEFDDLAPDGDVYLNTLRLVECSMFAAVTGLVYFLSNSLSIENYFGCFFSLPIVISSMRWGVAAGRKTMVATAMLLLVLSGPVKALAYLLTHGVLGFSMGSLWRLGVDWGLSIFLCTIARSAGAMGYILTSSFLIRENILALITINIHASLTFIFSAAGVNIVPSMNVIYVIFGTLVLLNSGFFVFLLHLLYSVFLTRLGMKASLRLPRWLEMAL